MSLRGLRMTFPPFACSYSHHSPKPGDSGLSSPGCLGYVLSVTWLSSMEH
jgi:hypothetical protein